MLCVQLNIANPTTGAMKVIEVDEEKQLYVCNLCVRVCLRGLESRLPIPRQYDDFICRPSPKRFCGLTLPVSVSDLTIGSSKFVLFSAPRLSFPLRSRVS